MQHRLLRPCIHRSELYTPPLCMPDLTDGLAGLGPRSRPLSKLQDLDCIVSAICSCSHQRLISAKIFSGASVSKEIGDRLAHSGVTLHPFWGRYVCSSRA